MAVKEKIEGAQEEPAEAEVEWNNVENELQLLQILCGTRPIGISKYFQMACIVEKLATNLNKEITSKSVWEHLSTMYDLKKLDEHEAIPFPNEETDFVLSTEDYGELMENMYLNGGSNGFVDCEKNGLNGVGPAEETPSDEPVIDITINNVVCSFSVKSYLNLKQIAQNGFNVEYRRENGMVTMRLRKPYTTASIWSSGKVTCTGATSEDEAKQAARRITRSVSKLGYPRLRLVNYRVVNVLGTCTMPFAIKITPFSAKHRDIASYEPELHPGVTYRLKEPKATLKIFSTGSITVTAPCVGNVQSAIEHIYPLVFEFRKERSPEDIRTMQATKRSRGLKRKFTSDFEFDGDECVGIDFDEDVEDEEDFDSDQSHD
nr:EOG090X0CO7 [Scapholeberis mucronata]